MSENTNPAEGAAELPPEILADLSALAEALHESPPQSASASDDRTRPFSTEIDEPAEKDLGADDEIDDRRPPKPRGRKQTPASRRTNVQSSGWLRANWAFMLSVFFIGLGFLLIIAVLATA